VEKKVASFRLRVETLAWLRSYADERGCTQADVVEMAAESLRGDAKAGVPDLPAPVAKPEPRVDGVVWARALLDRGVSPAALVRQRRLNVQKEQASKGKP
jgi:hypothetical protein